MERNILDTYNVKANITLLLGILHKLDDVDIPPVLDHYFKNTIHKLIIRTTPIRKYLTLILLAAYYNKFASIMFPSRYKDQGHVVICNKISFPI